MEIINTVTYEAGSPIWSQLIIGCLLALAAIMLLLCAYPTFKQHEIGAGILAIIAGIFFGVCGIGSIASSVSATTYHEYDVIFTEPIDMNEFSEKYIIKSQKGRIYHIEERH